jgi:hypothetical protein
MLLKFASLLKFVFASKFALPIVISIILLLKFAPLKFVLLIGGFFIILVYFVPQYQKNKENEKQREHERWQTEKEREFWLEKRKIKTKEKNDELIRQLIVDYVKTSPLISEGQWAYVVKRLIDEMHDTDNPVVEGNLDETIKRIVNEIANENYTETEVPVLPPPTTN